jgi:hypothetical protein
MDYTVITGAMAVTGLLVAIGAAAVVKVAPLVGKWGAGVLTRMFGR